MYGKTEDLTAAYQPVDSPAQSQHGPPKKIRGRVRNIVFNTFILTVPMILFTGFLLGLVLRYRVGHNEPLASENLRLPEDDDMNKYFFVKLNSTYLLFIASWSSSLAPILSACILALTSYPVAARLLKASEIEARSKLPTPWQLSLTLGMLTGGGFGSLWEWTKYLLGWRRKQAHGHALISVGCMLVLATFLGFLVFLADTWLHITTETVPFVQTTPAGIAMKSSEPTQASDALPQYSFILSDNCTYANNSYYQQENPPTDSNGYNVHDGCTLNIAVTANFLNHGAQTMQVLNNVSNTMTISTYDNEKSYAYAAVAQNQRLATTDFTATTFALSTECKPISKACDLNANVGASVPFNCSDAFSGNLVNQQFQMGYFTDDTLSDNTTFYGIKNPYYFGWAALTNPSTGSGLLGLNGSANIVDDGIVVPMHGGSAFILSCATTAYDVEYDFVNQTVTRFVAKVSNDSVANIAQATMSSVELADEQLKTAESLATFSDTSQQLADKLAQAYSKAAMALFSGAVVPRAAVAAQTRSTILVARVEKGALYALVVTNLLFVVAGLLLFFVALSAGGGGVRDARARLTIAGLVADRFESQSNRPVTDIEDLFAERRRESTMRIGIKQLDNGGYVYKEE